MKTEQEKPYTFLLFNPTSYHRPSKLDSIFTIIAFIAVIMAIFALASDNGGVIEYQDGGTTEKIVR